MKVSGFTFLRNAVTNGYPFEESIRSLLPLVDEYVIAIGTSTDDTLNRVRAIDDPRIRIIETCWNESMQDRGYVYGQQKMIAQFNCTGDWAFYLEGDEVLHEKDLDAIRNAMYDNLTDIDVEALYFDFLHFYGSVDQIGIAGYRRAPRIIRNSIRSIAPDGLFFVVMEKNKKGRYPKARFANAQIFHYGHARRAEYTKRKLEQVGKYWGRNTTDFNHYGNIDCKEIRDFSGSHPAVMTSWIEDFAEKNFEIVANYKPSLKNYRNRLRFWLEELFGIELSKKHYRDLE